MPQEPQVAEQPDTDLAQTVLDSHAISKDQKAAGWDAFHGDGDFEGNLKKANIPSNVKADLWDAKNDPEGLKKRNPALFEPKATISASPDRGWRGYLDDAEHDITQGGTRTALGRAAQYVGLPKTGTSGGVSEGVANLMGRVPVAPIDALGAAGELVTGHPIKAFNRGIKAVTDLGPSALALAPEAAGGELAENAAARLVPGSEALAGEATAALPKAGGMASTMIPRVVAGMGGQKLAVKGAQAAGVDDPDYLEAAGNVGALGAGGVDPEKPMTSIKAGVNKGLGVSADALKYASKGALNLTGRAAMAGAKAGTGVLLDAGDGAMQALSEHFDQLKESARTTDSDPIKSMRDFVNSAQEVLDKAGIKGDRAKVLLQNMIHEAHKNWDSWKNTVSDEYMYQTGGPVNPQTGKRGGTVSGAVGNVNAFPEGGIGETLKAKGYTAEQVGNMAPQELREALRSPTMIDEATREANRNAGLKAKGFTDSQIRKMSSYERGQAAAGDDQSTMDQVGNFASEVYKTIDPNLMRQRMKTGADVGGVAGAGLGGYVGYNAGSPIMGAAKGFVGGRIAGVGAGGLYTFAEATAKTLAKDYGITPEVARASVSDYIKNQSKSWKDKFEAWKMPTVSGGSTGGGTSSFSASLENDLRAALNPKAKGGSTRAYFKNAGKGPAAASAERMAASDSTAQGGTSEAAVAANKVEAPMSIKQALAEAAPGARPEMPILDEHNMPLTQPEQGRTPLARAIIQERNLGNPELSLAGTRGQRQGGLTSYGESVMRHLPGTGRDIAEGFDKESMRIGTSSMRSAIGQMDETKSDLNTGQRLQQRIRTIDQHFGENLRGEIIGGNPDAAVTVSPDTTKALQNAASQNPELTDYVNRPNATMGEIADLRKALRATESAPGKPGKLSYDAGKALDKDIYESMKADPELASRAEGYKTLAGESTKVAGELGVGSLKKIMDANPAVAYDFLLDMDAKNFRQMANRMSRAGQGVGDFYTQARQGMMERMFDKSSENGQFRSGRFLKELESQKDKFGADYNRFKVLGDGVAQLEKDMSATAKQGLYSNIPVLGVVAGGVITALAMHFGISAVAATGLGVLGVAGIEIGLVPFIARTLMTPSGLEESNYLWRVASNKNPTDAQTKIAKAKASHILKQAEAMKKAEEKHGGAN
jgi:hypothetical protein